MGLFSFFRSNRVAKNKKHSPIQRNTRRLELEALESRFMPSCNTISGYVYHDLNNNGIFEKNLGETPIVGSTVQLTQMRNGVEVEVATAISDANGYYEFAYDKTVSTQTTTREQVIDFATKDNPKDTNFTLEGVIEKFDPALGQLLGVTLIHEGEITSSIRVENTSTESESEIHAEVGGRLTLKVLGTSITSQLTVSENAGDYTATTYDGATDYNGNSGHTFVPDVSAYDKVITNLTTAQMQAFIGAGTLTLQEKAVATSFASGGGNLDVKLNSQGWGKVTVVYSYIPNNCLEAGNYTIKQLTTPAEYPLDGKETRDGVPMNNPVNISTIPVTLVEGVDLVNNNFGELQPTTISGHVYYDRNNDGVMAQGDPRLPGVTVALMGVDDLGEVTPRATTTDENGFYKFENLRPGKYTITETQPTTHLDGKDTIGTKPAEVVNDDTFINITLKSGESSINNNFGELLPASLSGYVYVDSDDDGVKDDNESGIAGVTVTLSGTDDHGAIVPIIATTNAAGYYEFTKLRPGTYTITETHPTQYKDGKDTAGTPIGSGVSNDVITAINLAAGVNGQNNNFGELEQADLAIDKTANKESTKTGEQLTYTLTVTNLGNHTARDVVIRDILPTSATFVSASTGNLTFVNGVLTMNVGTLAVNGSVTITVTITVPTTEGSITNTAVVSSSTFDPNLSNNQDAVTTPVIREKADLAIEKIASAEQVSTGQELTYTLIITNLGTHTAKNLVVTDSLPPGAAFISALAAGWASSNSGGVLTFTTGELAAGAFKVITITVKAPPTAGTFVNASVVSSSTFDPNLSNNQDSVSTVAVAEKADLAIDKAVNHSQVKTGEELTYTLIVTNLGTHTAKNVVVTDTLPTGSTFVSATSAGWVRVDGTGKLTFSTGEIAAGAFKVITITIKAPSVSGVIMNMAEVTSETPDPNLENNHDFAVTTVTYDGKTFPKTIAPLEISVTTPQVTGKIRATNSWSAEGLTTRRAQHAYIDGVIRSLFGRPSTAQEQSDYYFMMKNGMTQAQFVNLMWNSDEHYSVMAEGYYETFFHRTPTALEKAQLINTLKGGANEMDVAYSFLTSTEYLAAHSTPETFIRGFYQDVLGQIPSSTTEQFWVNAMGVGTVQSVTLNMLKSTDTLKEIVDVAYAQTLHRWATAEELQLWSAKLASGQVTPGELMKQLLASQDFFSLTYSLID